MPHLGDNAIYKAARAIDALGRFAFEEAAHQQMGRPTLVVSQMQGGMNINSVPDRAEFCVNVRTIPDQNLAVLRHRIDMAIGDELTIEPLVELPSMFSDPDDPWVQSVFEIAHDVAGRRRLAQCPTTRTPPC